MSFPPANEMFQFAGFAPHDYVFIMRYPKRGGLPHSEIPGSKPAHNSPGLIAACHVLHRLYAPRHPPDALVMLERDRPCAGINPNAKNASLAKNTIIKESSQTEPTKTGTDGREKIFTMNITKLKIY